MDLIISSIGTIGSTSWSRNFGGGGQENHFVRQPSFSLLFLQGKGGA